MKEFCVYLTMYKGELLPKWYIGSSSVKKIKNNYNGSVSSHKWRNIYYEEQKENKHLFKTRILSTHETRKQALEEELRVQKLHSVRDNNKYFNESYAKVNGYFGRDVSGENNVMKRPDVKEKHLLSVNTLEYKEKMSLIKTGTPHSEETKEKIKNIAIEKGFGKWNKGIPKTEQENLKQREIALNRPRLKCSYCENTYTKQNLQKHENSCKNKNL